MDENPVFERITADDGAIYFCPLGEPQGRGSAMAEEMGDCIAADVVGRYSGHLNLAE